MGKLIDLTGRRFERLVVIERADNTNAGKPRWLCLCDCGKNAVVSGSDLKAGKVLSCGCKKKEQLTTRNFVHGMEGSKLYHVWKGMKQRCSNPNHKGFAQYGGKGISVCNEWLADFETFYNWSMKNGYQDGLSIDRIDNDKGYSPDNCRWATPREQNNNKRSNKLITIDGKTKTAAQWGLERGIRRSTYDRRLRSGWTPEETFGFKQRSK